MLYLKERLDVFIEDVNNEDSVTLDLFENVLSSMFFLIKWAGIPFVFYLIFRLIIW